MKPDEEQLLRDLLAQQRVLALSVLVDGAPYVGMLPYAIRPDLGSLLVHASDLARHTRGLGDGAPYAALIQTPDGPGADPLRLPRVSLEGTVRKLDKGGGEYREARVLYVGKFPASARIFGLGDFNLYQLTVEKGRFVAGFGSAHTVSPRVLRHLAGEV